MAFALDANAISDGLREQGGVAQRMRSTGPALLAMPSLVVVEVRFSSLGVGRQGDLAAFDVLAGDMRQPEFDAEAADHAARNCVQPESAGAPIGPADLLIAATARRLGCSQVAHNTREFSRMHGPLPDDWY